MSLLTLPDVTLGVEGELGTSFVDAGSHDYRAAARHVRDLPYGRNTDRSDYRLVLPEGRGTCSTKHALLAALASEHDAPVGLRLGIYLMNGRNTPGVGPVLRRHGMEELPEAHCYLVHRGRRVDLTTADVNPVGIFLHEETIEPDGIGAYKLGRHLAFLRSWAEERGLDPDRVWRAREDCIAALSRRDV